MILDMPRPRYQYVQREVSRHGTVSWYFRIGDGPRTRLRGEYGSKEFVSAWQALMAGESFDVEVNACNDRGRMSAVHDDLYVRKYDERRTHARARG